MSDKQNAVTKANHRAIAEASRAILSELKRSSKGEPMRPQLIEGMLKRVGGLEKLGDIFMQQLMKCSQIDPNTGLENPALDWKPQVGAKYAELAVRVIGQEDDKQSFDPASLNDVDLQAVLQGLLVEQVNNNPEFCKALINVVMDQNPRLIHDAIDPKPIDAESVKEVKQDLTEVGLDEKDAGEE